MFNVLALRLVIIPQRQALHNFVSDETHLVNRQTYIYVCMYVCVYM